MSKEHSEPKLWKNRKNDRVDSLGFYREYRNGATRNELYHSDLPLYRELTLEGLLGEVPRGVVTINDDPVTYFKDNFSGRVRSQVARVPSLYWRLKSDGLDKILGHGHTPVYEDPWGYYEEHYRGIGRGQLQNSNHTLYLILKKKGLLDRIPLKGKEDALEAYRREFNGLTDRELSLACPTLFARFRRWGLINQLPKGDSFETARNIRKRLWNKGYLK